MKEYKQFGAYGIIIENNQILLVKKSGGPYNGLLDLPGGTIEFCEKPEATLKRELMEEVGIKVELFKLFDVDSVSFKWQYKEDLIFKVHHIGVFYEINKYNNDIKSSVELDEQNNDSLGASFYKISELKKNMVSKIVFLELEKLGYNLK